MSQGTQGIPQVQLLLAFRAGRGYAWQHSKSLSLTGVQTATGKRVMCLDHWLLRLPGGEAQTYSAGDETSQKAFKQVTAKI